MRKVSLLLLRIGLAASIFAGCSNSMEPTQPEPVRPDLGLLNTLSQTLKPVLGTVSGLLTCTPESYSSTSQVIGPQGGSVVMGHHRLDVPAGALNHNVTITGEVMPGLVNSVRFSPEGLTFAHPATLTLSYENCNGLLAPKKIVYTSELLQILETLLSTDQPAAHDVQAPINHFSRYAVAW
jgi:hypothetical protein